MTGPCVDDVCLTCADQAVPAVIIQLAGHDLATVLTCLDGSGDAGTPDPGAEPEEISVALVDAGPGDTVLVHAGEAIAVLDRVVTGAGDESH